MTRFEPGRTLITREVWRGEIWAVRPMRCVRDDGYLALWFPRGTPWLHPSQVGGGRVRVPVEPWELQEATWHLNDNLILIREGEAHAVHLFFDTRGAQLGWYVNLQDPIRRNEIGFDYMDHALDLIAPPDAARAEWKDEDDFLEYASLVGPERAAAVRAEGERVLARMHAGAWPFDGSLDGFTPDPSWGTPRLDDRWRTFPIS